MIVLGIDPGTATTGYGVLKETAQGEVHTLDFGVISTPAGLSLEKRLLIIFKSLKELIQLHKPESGAVEELFFQRNVKTALSVGQARGVILLAFAESGLPVTNYSPLEIKLAVVGYGRADKNQVQQMVRALLNLPDIPRPDDAADALAAAICHLHSMRFKQLTSTDQF